MKVWTVTRKDEEVTQILAVCNNLQNANKYAEDCFNDTYIFHERFNSNGTLEIYIPDFDMYINVEEFELLE